ncbi:MAG TPA: S8 family serine peptidase [Gaiellaceae bacterium]|nr:S8 family serine peptidase [Gaiellaceae bacterium]
MRRADRRVLLLGVTLVAVAAAVFAIREEVGGSRSVPWPAHPTGTWNGLVAPRPAVALPPLSIVVLHTPSVAERAAGGGPASPAQVRAWSADARAAQDAVVARLSAGGVRIRPLLRFTRVLDGFSAAVDPATAAQLESDPDVAGVYPVRVAYPALDSSEILADPSFGVGSGHRLQAPPAGLAGSGVTIALLDTHVDATVAYLHNSVLPEVDVVARAPGAAEVHGTELAGLLIGGGGPGGIGGAAPGAQLLPIRVAGLQRDAAGTLSVFARSDQIVAGLDRAVDPNQDGDRSDAARIAVLALAEPFAGFGDSPEAQAVAGATELGTLVVAAAGNDGPAAERAGDLSGPGAAPDALTVGAVDARPTVPQARVSLRAGGTTYSGDATLAGVVQPAHSLGLSVQTRPAKGKAVFVRGGPSPVAAVHAAGVAGAAAILVGATAPLAAGGLPLDPDALVPTLSLPPTISDAVQRALAAGKPVHVSISRAEPRPNRNANGAARFSSTGLSFDGLVKPEALAPGVSIATSAPNAPDGQPRWATVSGTSAAAAVAAGDAALLAQQHPSFSAAELRAFLVGNAVGLGGVSFAAQGAGLLTAVGASEGRLLSLPDTLVLHAGRAEFRIENVSAESVGVTLRTVHGVGAATLHARLSRRRLTIPALGSATVRLTVAATPAAGASVVTGVVLARAADGRGGIRIPWALAFPRPEGSLLGDVTLSSHGFSASDRSPAVLAVDAGRVDTPVTLPDIHALSRLDVELWRNGSLVGLLARLRDVLPGHYTFGLTGRGPDGNLLAPGGYELQVVAVPVDGGNPTRRKLRFALH